MPSLQLLKDGATEPCIRENVQRLTLVAELGRAPTFEAAVHGPLEGQTAFERAHCGAGARLRIELGKDKWLGPDLAQTDWRFIGGTVRPEGEASTLSHVCGRYLEPALEAWLNQSLPPDAVWIIWQKGMQETLDACLHRVCGGHTVAGDRLQALLGASGIPEVAAWIRPAGWTNRRFLDALVAHLELNGLPIVGWRIDGPQANQIDFVTNPADADGSKLDLNSWQISGASGGTFILDGLTPADRNSTTVLTRELIGGISMEQVVGFLFGDKRSVPVGQEEVPRKPGVFRIQQATGPANLFLARRIELTVEFDNKGIKSGKCCVWLDSLSRKPACAALPNARIEAKFLGWDESGVWARLEPAPNSTWKLLKEWPTEPQPEKNGLFVGVLAPGRQRKENADGLFLAMQVGDLVSVRIESGLHPVIEGILQKQADVDDSKAAVLRVRKQSVDVDAGTVSLAQNVAITKVEASIKGKLIVDQDAAFKANVNVM